jgi:DNA-directed RNA polymerase specialized sigma24 family protein
LIGAEVTRTVEYAMTRLTPLERRSVEGVAGGLSYIEVSKRWGCAAKTVDNAAQRGRRKIREALEAAA